MLRAIREIKPTYVVGENVSGLISWNGGMVFEEVQADLEAEGYEVQPFLLPAASIGAPHRRDRVWFVAYSGSNGYQSGGFGKDRSAQTKSQGERNQRERVWNDGGRNGESGNVANTERQRQSGQGRPEGQKRSTQDENWKASWTYADGRWPTEQPICSGNDGLSERLDGITFRKWSEESIKGYGNAIVPQVALQIFKAIEKILPPKFAR